MKHKYILLNLLLLAGITAVVFTQIDWHRDQGIVKESPPIDDSFIDATIPTSEKIPKIRNARVDWDAISKRYGTGHEVSFTIEEEEAFNELHVLPMNWIDQLNCTVDGQCVFTYKYPQHPYASIDKDELVELGYADPLAALYLGLRYGDEWTEENRRDVMWDGSKFEDNFNSRISLYLRAAALSGKSGPLMRLVGEGLEGQSILGVPEPVKKIAVLRIAEKLGDPRADWKAEFEEQSEEIRSSNLKFQTPKERALEVVKFEEAVESWYQHYMANMDAIQQEVTGSNQIRGFALNKDDQS